MAGKKPEKRQAKISPFWKRVDELISRPKRRIKRGINLSRLSKLTKPNQTVVIATKLLGSGKIGHPLSIAALAISSRAKEEVKKAGGKIIELEELREKNPDGKGLIVLI